MVELHLAARHWLTGRPGSPWRKPGVTPHPSSRPVAVDVPTSLSQSVGPASYGEVMSDFDYRPEPGIIIDWVVTLSGFGDDEYDGEYPEALHDLSDVEALIEDYVGLHQEQTGEALTRVRGSHGWREYTWSGGAVHRYEWRHVTLDLRCQACLSPQISCLFMVTDAVWEQAGLDGWVCFRCVEASLGRKLRPEDFKPGLPANTDETYHEPELRQRLGLADAS